MITEAKLMLKEVNTGRVFVLEDSESFERYTIMILKENSYTVEEMAKFFGLRWRAMYSKINKLGINLKEIGQKNIN